MHLFFLRHAKAVPRGTPGYPNDDRPLTEEGIARMRIEAKGIKTVAGSFDFIISSPLTRALETAKITAEETEYEKQIIITEHLLPGGLQKKLFDLLAVHKREEKILLVGHEPHLGYVTSKLIGADESVIFLKKGAICRIDIEGFPIRENGKLIWLIQPDELKLLGAN